MRKLQKNYNLFENKNVFNWNTLRIIRNQIRGKELDPERRNEYIEDTISVIDIVTERLDYDYENNPLKLIGLKCTYTLINSIYTFLFSLTIALGQFIISNYISN